MPQLTSLNNEAVHLARSLRQRKYRERYGLFLLEGRHLLEEALEAGAELAYVFYTGEFRRNEQGRRLLHRLKERSGRCLEVSKPLMAALSTTATPPGIVAVARQRPFAFDTLLAAATEPLVLVADGIQDPGNLGTMIRTALAAGATGVVLTTGTVDLYNEKVVRATQGAIFRLPVVTGMEAGALATRLLRAGLRLVVADVRGDTVYYQADLTGPLALVLGNENRGPGDELVQVAKVKVRIPLWGTIESLNAAVAAGILLYEVARQRLG